jgi:hypothetical protein
MQGLHKLDAAEMEETRAGEAITLAGVLAVMAIAIIVVICYRFFVSPKGKATFPGGFQFEWGSSGK